jgi:hypothetical protein
MLMALEREQLMWIDMENITDISIVLTFNDYLTKTKARLQTGILMSYLITMIMGLTGNALVIYVIGKYSQVRNKSVANYYIWNLAFADLMFSLILPFFCYSTYYDKWGFCLVFCKMAAAFKETMRYTSMFTLYLASFYNLAHLRTIKVGIIVCSAIWIISGTIAVPYAMYAKLQKKTNTTHKQCAVILPSETVMILMTYFELVSALLVPLLLISISYVLLALRMEAMLSQGTNRNMTRTVLVIVITFIIWQTPYHVNNIINLHKLIEMSHSGIQPTHTDILVSMYLNTLSTILVFISSCCNPIIYGILNDNYSKYMHNTLSMTSLTPIIISIIHNL